MLSCRSGMALLAVIALTAKAAEGAIAAPDVCSDADVSQGFCLTCKEKARCVTANAPPESRGECTEAGEACTVLAGVATCKPFAETSCSCDSATQCDAYDPDSVLVCLSGGITFINNCSDSGEICVEGACEAVTTTTTLSPGQLCGGDDGFVVKTPECTSATYCSQGTPIGDIDCDSGMYFDMAVMECVSLPPVPCSDCVSGACPDKSDCSKWYICQDGEVLDEETCDPAVPDFDIVTSDCVESGTGTCTGNANCTYGLTTVPGGGSTDGGSGSSSAPSDCTAANVGERYPYEGDCKKYWACRKVGTDLYANVVGTCLGSLVFNPETSYCDVAENVPGCDSTSSG